MNYSDEEKQIVLTTVKPPVFLIMNIEAGSDIPQPALSIRDGEHWLHVEYNEKQALKTAKQFGELRVAHRELYPKTVGSAVMQIDSMSDLKNIAKYITPAPAGWCSHFHCNHESETWEGVFVRWEKVHDWELKR